MSLPWLKGAISGPIRVYGLTVTAAHFSADRGGGGGEGGRERGEQGGWGLRLLCCLCRSA